MRVGQIVFSKRGRDKGKTFVIVDVIDEYVFLTDGNLRPLAKPKKKKAKHVQPTNHIVDFDIKDIKDIKDGRGLQDADIRKFIFASRDYED
jgi:ribosomal protein L14E/L6E/L27E